MPVYSKRNPGGKPDLYYEIHGKGYPLLLIAGLNADNVSWAGVFRKLARHFRVILFDNRGSGRSGVPSKKYSIRDMADDVAGLCDHLGIKKCHVVGHSMGGYIAQEMAINYPGRVDKIVLEATGPASSACNYALFNDMLSRFEKGHDKEALMRSWSYWLFSRVAFERKHYIDAYIKNTSVYPYFQSAPGFRGQLEAIRPFNSLARLKNIKAKTLIIIGSDDILVSSAGSKKLVTGIKGSILREIKGVGHCAHVEKPDIFTSMITQFLLKKL